MNVLASDYDGTLKYKDEVTKEDIEAIRMWRNAGNVFGIVTGRSMESIQKEIMRYDIEVDFVIGNNGGVLYDQNFNEIKRELIDFHKAEQMLAYLRKEHCISYVVNDGFHRAKVVLDASREDKKYANFTSVYTEADMLKKQMIAQIVASVDNEADTERIATYINQEFQGYAVGYRNVNCVDIIPYGISKATGLTYMVSYMSYDPTHVYTIGDSYNDIPMLTDFYGYAMIQSPLQVKQTAKAIVDSVGACIEQIIHKKK